MKESCHRLHKGFIIALHKDIKIISGSGFLNMQFGWLVILNLKSLHFLLLLGGGMHFGYFKLYIEIFNLFLPYTNWNVDKLRAVIKKYQ